MMSLIRRILKIPQTSERKKKEADAKKKNLYTKHKRLTDIENKVLATKKGRWQEG